MEKLAELVVAHGWQLVESAAWQWAAGLDAEMLLAVETALALDGVDGIGDLAAAGSALGGLGDGELAQLSAFVMAQAEPGELAA